MIPSLALTLMQLQLKMKPSNLRPEVFFNNFGRPTVGENSSSRDQVFEKFFAVKIRREFDSTVVVVKNRVLLTTMDNVMKPKVQTTARSITESSGRGPNSIVQNPDKKDFSGNTANITLISASS